MARRVLVLTTSYPRSPADPAGVFVAEQVRALRAAGFSVRVLHPQGPLARAPEPGTIEVPWLWPRRAQVLFGGPGAPETFDARPWLLGLGPLVAGALLVRAAREVRWADAIVSHWILPCGLIGALLASRARPHVAFCHSGDLSLLERLPARRALAGALAGRCTRIAFVGAHLQDRFAALDPRGASRGLLLPMGVEVPVRVAPRRRLATDDPVRALVLARLVPIKGVDVAVRAAGAGLLVTVAGDGPERARLEAMAPAGVRFLGRVPPSSVPRLIEEHDVVLVPSRVMPDGRTEGTPRAALEALAHGRPLVASAVGGLSALAVAAGLTLVAPEDPAALRAAALEAARAGAPVGTGSVLGWPEHVQRLERALFGGT